MNICIFDTETVGKVSQDLLNVGYKIIDLNIQQGTYKVLQERDYLVGKLFNNTIYMLNDDFVGAEKYAKYTLALQNKTIIKRGISQIMETMRNDLKKHNVLFTYAYNNAFDMDKFEKTCGEIGCENPIKNENCFDIWAYACKYIVDTNEYKEWAKENEIFTATGTYISTSVESVIKYLNNNLEFTEDHTALSDVQWETKILIECVKRGCDITRPIPLKRYFPSEKVNKKVIKLPDGSEINVEYKKTYERNGVISYK